MIPLELIKTKTVSGHDTDLTEDQLAEIITAYKRIVFTDQHGKAYPQNPRAQLRMAIVAVFGSWNDRRAIDYRRVNRIPDTLGTAVNVQAISCLAILAGKAALALPLTPQSAYRRE